MKAKRKMKTAAKSVKGGKAKAAKKVKSAKKPVQSSTSKNSVAVKLQKEVAAAIGAYMDKQGIGFNEFARRLGTSATQMQKIQKGSANLTFASLGQIASVMKKNVKLVWG